MATILKTTVTKSTWLCQPAKQTTHQLEVSVLGLRIVEFKNDGDDEISVRLIKGDGRKSNFEELVVYTAKSQEEADGMVKALAKAS